MRRTEKRMKIAVIGYSGSGKSVLTKALGEKYGIPVLHLDRVHWLSDWRERSPEEEAETVVRFMDENPDWVIDGNYAGLSFERRMEEADRIIFLNFNRFSCLLRAFRRYRENRGKSRDSMAEGCLEKMDGEFVRWILWEGRKKKRRARYRAVAERYPEKSVVVKNQKELDRLGRETL